MRALALFLAILATPLFALEPDEVLDDPVLEERARALSKELRCLVCGSESIAESNADLARDLRIFLREQLVAGDTDEEAVAKIVALYGENVLLRPTTDGANLILWLSGPALLLVGIGLGVVYIRRQSQADKTAVAGLSDAEKARLRDILDDG